MKDTESISRIENNDFINVAISKKQHHHTVRVEEDEIDEASGFSLLRRHGFDDDDIGTLRSLFSLEIQNMVNSTERFENETDSEHRRRIEDAWVRSNIRHFTSSGAGERGRGQQCAPSGVPIDCAKLLQPPVDQRVDGSQ